jgi:hypothetical protein
MMNTVRDTFHSIGDRSGDLARSMGSGTVDLARRLGDGTASLARQVGPRRALIGLAVAAVAIGGAVFVVRYLRARRAERDLGIDDATTDRTAGASSRSHVPGGDARISY